MKLHVEYTYHAVEVFDEHLQRDAQLQEAGGAGDTEVEAAIARTAAAISLMRRVSTTQRSASPTAMQWMYSILPQLSVRTGTGAALPIPRG